MIRRDFLKFLSISPLSFKSKLSNNDDCDITDRIQNINISALKIEKILKQELQIVWSDESTTKYILHKINKHFLTQIKNKRLFYAVSKVYKTSRGFIFGISDMPLNNSLSKNVDIIYYDIICKESKW